MCYPDFSAKFTGDGTAGLFLVSLLSGVNLRDSLLNHSKNDLWWTACIQLCIQRCTPKTLGVLLEVCGERIIFCSF